MGDSGVGDVMLGIAGVAFFVALVAFIGWAMISLGVWRGQLKSWNRARKQV
jgi:hypothetical protein